MNIQGTYTNKGLALTAKTAAGARVVGGSGHTTDVPNAAQLPEIRQTLAVGEARCAGNTAVLPVTLAAVELEDSYTLTELGYSLKPILDAMLVWGENYKKKVETEWGQDA